MLFNVKKGIKNFQYNIESKLYPNSIMVDWSPGFHNFGDILNPVLLKFITGKHIINVSTKYCKYSHFLAIGSVLDRAISKSMIWGSGFISKESKLLEIPKSIYAVRGPKTRELILKHGVKCPEVYGDPALLIPEYYYPKIEKKYKIGIIPHYVDKSNNWIESVKFNKEVKIIDIQNENPLKVIDQMLECEAIASSSLHGLIVSDAYQIPSLWIKFSDLLTGGDFKFNDYYLSIGHQEKSPFIIEDNTSINKLSVNLKQNKINLNLELLKNSLPVI